MRRPETPRVLKGRGTTAQPANRFAKQRVEAVDDRWGACSAEAGEPVRADGGKPRAYRGGEEDLATADGGVPWGYQDGEQNLATADGGVPWGHQGSGPTWFDPDGEAPPHPETRVTEERARSIVSHNDSPDVGFDSSINPYRGCEHGCIYCFARPTHAYLDLSPGLDFETRLYAKTNAAAQLRVELARPKYRVSPIALGINTDAYQPTERRYRITRGVLEVLAETRHPVSIITKNALVERDLDLLAPMAREGLATVYFSVTTLDNRLAAKMEPRASAPHARLRAMRALQATGVPVGVMVAPVIPALTDPELESILEAAREAGAGAAGYVLLRLPHEIKDLFRDWLAERFPDRAAHVMSLVRQMSGGKDYNPEFGRRMRGAGPFAQLLQRRFMLAQSRLGFGRLPPLRCDLFVAPSPPKPPSPQASLF